MMGKRKGKVDVVGLVVHIWAALKVLVQAMAADSEGGKRITKSESAAIMRRSSTRPMITYRNT